MKFRSNIKLEKKIISNNNNPFIIAEIGSNFNQNLNTAKKLIYLAKKNGADAVKFQLFKADILYPKHKNIKMNKIFSKIEIKQEWLKKLKDYSDKLGIICFASAFDLESAKFLEKIKVKAHKIASSELTNIQLIDYISKTKKTVFVSTGMSDFDDINKALKIFKKNKNDKLILMQCGSMYPLNYENVNLNVLRSYKKKYKVITGFSDHTLDNLSALVALGKDAIVFEKHITLDKKLKGPDHFYALEPKDFKKYVHELKKGYMTLGSSFKDLIPIEKQFSRREGLYYKLDLKSGTKILKKHLYTKRPPLGLRSKYIKDVLGKKLKDNVKKDEPLMINILK